MNTHFTDRTGFGLTFNGKMKLEHATLSDVRDGNFELIQEYVKVPS